MFGAKDKLCVPGPVPHCPEFGASHYANNLKQPHIWANFDDTGMWPMQIEELTVTCQSSSGDWKHILNMDDEIVGENLCFILI